MRCKTCHDHGMLAIDLKNNRVVRWGSRLATTVVDCPACDPFRDLDLPGPGSFGLELEADGSVTVVRHRR